MKLKHLMALLFALCLVFALFGCSVEVNLDDVEINFNEESSPESNASGNTDPTGGTTAPSVPPEPSDPTNPSAPTDPSQPGEKTYLTYEEYRALSGEEQQEYMYTFKKPDGSLDVRAFNDWYNAAKKAYDEAHPKETIGPDGNITLD